MPRFKKETLKVVNVNDLLELIGMSLIDDIVTELQSDKWVPKLKTGSMFKLNHV